MIDEVLASGLVPPDPHPDDAAHDTLGGGPQLVERRFLASQRPSDHGSIVSSASMRPTSPSLGWPAAQTGPPRAVLS